MHLPPPLPTTPEEIAAALTLTHFAAVTGVQRHAGRLAHLYTPKGRQTVARGRDLTACRLVIGTGGALTRLPGGEAVLRGHARRGRPAGSGCCRRRTRASPSTATTSSPAAARCAALRAGGRRRAHARQRRRLSLRPPPSRALAAAVGGAAFRPGAV